MAEGTAGLQKINHSPFGVHSPLMMVAWTLLASGLLHGVAFLWTGGPWEGAVTLRKPVLFGISGGLTLWSVDWVWNKLAPWKWDAWLRAVMAVSLALEVILITGQIWRGEPSHFNRNGWLNARVDELSLVLITVAVLILLILTLRSFGNLSGSNPIRLAIRAGMILLLLSCLMGYATSFIGYLQIDLGKPPEILGKAGVMKFPHGACLHAIQTIPMLAIILPLIRLPLTWWRMMWWINAHIFFLIFASWQTFTGRDRFEANMTGMILLGFAGFFGILAIMPAGFYGLFYRSQGNPENRQ